MPPATIFTLSFDLMANAQFKMLQSDSMRRELIILQSALTTLHPGIYRYQTKAQLENQFTLAKNKVEHPLPENRYFIIIGQLLEKIHCGHTYTNYWNQPKTLSKALFSEAHLPFLFRILGRRMIVTHNLSANKLIHPGDEINRINGIPISRIIDSLLTVSPSDGLHGVSRKLDNISIEPLDADTSNFNLFDIYFPLFFTGNFSTPVYQLTINAKKSITVKPLTRSERIAVYNQRFGKLPVHEANWELKLINSNTAIFRIGDFETWEWKMDYHHFLDSIFTLLYVKNIKNLVVDIRGNGGGDDAARDEVFAYLTRTPFGCDEPMRRYFRFLSVPNALLPYLKTWDKSFAAPKNPADYSQLSNGLYVSKAEAQAPCVPIQPKPNRFTGKIFLLTDNRNASTTFTLTKLFRTGHIGQIIGEPTSGNQQGVNGGQFFFLNLPYSKIEVDIPLVWGSYNVKHHDTGIYPDRLIAVTPIAIRQGRDKALEYVLRQCH
jgi:hypothetical protein